MYNLWSINYLDCPGTERQMKGHLAHYKSCPFCYYEDYLYKTYPGLLRHLFRYHLQDIDGNSTHYSFKPPRKLVVYTSSGMETVDIENLPEVEEFLKDYIKDKRNPSKKSSRLWRYVLEEENKTS